MANKVARVAVSSIVILSAVCLLFFYTFASGADYYKHVDEVMVSPEQWYGKRLQLHGFVVEGSVFKSEGFDYKFKIKTGAYEVPATYTGLMPDTFKDGSEVVLTGRLGPTGFSVAKDGVTAKCPSRYEAGKTGTDGK